MKTSEKKTPADIVAGLVSEADRCAAEVAALRKDIETKGQRILSLALEIRQGDGIALAEVGTLRAEIAAAKEQLPLTERAEQILRTEAQAERDKEKLQRTRHLKRKTRKALEALPPIAARIEAQFEAVIREIKLLEATAEPIAISWQSEFGAKPPVLYPGSVTKMLGHALFMIIRKHGATLPEIKYHQVQGWNAGLADFWATNVKEAGEQLLADDSVRMAKPAIEADEQREEFTPAAPHVWTDAEIAAANAQGNPHGWPLSPREWAHGERSGEDLKPTMPDGHDFDVFGP
ncbi:hypothetical protein DLM45_15325 [Hyphomicrobium methylovorum]|uniref:hypothetical protein n=1 Tax=Hyphomicrobium methylovorum TaxID=84 RepID=UPI0015E76E74|nr:hypothetical protein [Hyphomicrobium methylovorum]MBA2127582.1 hypothetical protein [Hyphomicrobium methylovorum]